ncbi:MAG: type 4a pilus biogenesis protein PilO [Nitrospirota bacterium]
MKLPGKLQWDRLSERERMIVGLTLTVVLGAVGFYFYEGQQQRVMGLKSRLRGLENEISMLKAELPLKEVAVKRAEGQQIEAEERLSLAAQTQQQLKGGRGFSSLMTEMARMAKDEGVEVISIELGSPRDQGSYLEMPATITLQAEFRTLGEYLHRLQHLPQLVVVGKVRMETSEQISPMLTAGVETVSFMGKT